jgi:hypothetical protein
LVCRRGRREGEGSRNRRLGREGEGGTTRRMEGGRNGKKGGKVREENKEGTGWRREGETGRTKG